MAQNERRRQGEGMPKVLEDRVRPDAELVDDVLDPRHPDERDGADGVDSIADLEMSRRTDAANGSVLPWLVGAAVVMLVVAAVAFS